MARQDWNLTETDFGVLLPYVKNDEITDIEYNGTDIWITDINNNIKKVDIKVDPREMFNFAIKVSNKANKPFDRTNNVLEAETDTLRISILHEACTNTGLSICIRQSPPKIRLTPKTAIERKYCSKEIISLLANCIKAKLSFVFCGEPQVGKTELAKFCSQFIPDNQKVITIEDSAELHYKEIHPNSNCVEILINQNMTYDKAIKASLRQNPKWLMLSEARSKEVAELLKCLSTGVSGITTLHADDARKIPDRILNMSADKSNAERIENDVYSYIDIGVYINRQTDENGNLYRYIDQICFFTRNEGYNRKTLILNEGHNTEEGIPSLVLKKMEAKGIENPFINEQVNFLLQ